MKLEWKPVPGWEEIYMVSNFGHVMNVLTGKLRSTKGRVSGYPALTLFSAGRDKKQQTFFVHVVVAAAFLGPRPVGFDVMHVDGNRENPRADNLRYGTRRENNMDKVHHGTDTRGSKAWNVRLTEEQVRAIRRAKGKTNKEWAKELGCHPQTIQSAKEGSTWAWLN